MHKKLIIWDYPRREHIKAWVTIAAALVIGAAVTGLSGCAALQERPATVAFIAEYATNKVIYEDDNPAEKAARIAAVANEALAVVDASEAAEIAFIKEAVERAINWDGLSPPDRAAARRLVDILAEELEIRLGAGLLNPEDVASVRRIIEIVRDTAANFVLEE